MDGEYLTQVAERAGTRYGLLLESFRSALAGATGQAPWSARLQVRLAERLYEFSSDYMAAETPLIAEQLQATAREATRSTGERMHVTAAATEPTLENAADHGTALDAAMRLQLERDIAATLAALRQVALGETLRARASGMERRGGDAIASLAQGALRHDFLDRAGKRWPSQKYIRTIWRHAMVRVWNESAMLTMAEHGLTGAEIRHPDINYGMLGQRIDFLPDTAGLHWLKVEEIFHPNTNAYMAPAEAA
jgi:hypothetical protein